MATISIDMFIPDKQEIPTVMQEGLSTDFEEVTVKWVDCPDLTQYPFFLATPGLCGDTAILDIGGISNLFPSPKKTKEFYFKNIIRRLNRYKTENLIIGGGLYARQWDKHLGELIMNASFCPHQSNLNEITVKNESRIAFLETDEELYLERLTYTNPYCNMYGNFFVSNGRREQVLKVEVNKRIGRYFIDALQHTIETYYGKDLFVGLGGTFLVKNGKAKHHVILNEWNSPVNTKDEIRKCIEYHDVQTPVVGFTTFVSADSQIVDINSNLRDVFLTRSRAYGYSTQGGGHFHWTEPKENLEYLGYFSLATKLYRIDPVPIFNELADFSYLEKI